MVDQVSSYLTLHGGLRNIGEYKVRYNQDVNKIYNNNQKWVFNKAFYVQYCLFCFAQCTINVYTFFINIIN